MKPSPETPAVPGKGPALLQRVAESGRKPVGFVLNGQPLTALAGDTVLTAVLTHSARLRFSEFSGEPRAGFCLMGACQDCWVWDDAGRRLRACSTVVAEGMSVRTTPPASPWGETGARP